MLEPDYISTNRRAYDLLAPQYRARAFADREKDVGIIAPFAHYLDQEFGSGARVLDVGPGHGINLAMLSDAGFRVTGIDISQEMLDVARSHCPAAELIHADFLNAPFLAASFEGIFAKASIHLFPKADAIRCLTKMSDLLVDKGMLYVATTASSHSAEGYSEKSDYRDSPVRFRKHWTPSELLDGVTSVGLTVFSSSYNWEAGWNKRWFNVWALKKPVAGGEVILRA